MAKAMREVLVCDVCGSETDVSAVSVTVDGVAQSSELCAEHRKGLMDALAGVIPAPSATSTARASRSTKKAAAAGGKTAKPAAEHAERRGVPKRTVTCPHCGATMSVQNLSRHISAKHPGAE